MDHSAERERRNAFLVTGAIVIVVIAFAARNWWPGITPKEEGVAAPTPSADAILAPQPDIYVYDLAYDRDERLTDFSGPDVDPAWSPDGTRIAFARFSETTLHDIYVMDADGGDLVRVVGGPTDDYWPSWSPDGEEIVFMSDRTSFADVFTASVATGAVRVERIGTSPTGDEFPDWSPVENRIAYVDQRQELDESRVYTVRSDATGQRIVAVFEGWRSIQHIDWSPDGKRLAVTRQDDTGADVWVVRARGGGLHQVTFGSAGDGFASWAPDGKRLVFMTNRHTTNGDDLYVVNAEGSEEKELFRTPWYDGYPDWSPDGRYIAFESIEGAG